VPKKHQIGLDEPSHLSFLFQLEWLSLVGTILHPANHCNQTPARCNEVAQPCCQTCPTPSNSLRECTQYSLAYSRGLSSPSIIICCLSAPPVLSPGWNFCIVHHVRIPWSMCSPKCLVLLLRWRLLFLLSQVWHHVYFDFTPELLHYLQFTFIVDTYPSCIGVVMDFAYCWD